MTPSDPTACLASLDDLPAMALLAGAAALGGAVNSFAGGGTILTFPVLAAILPPDPGRLVTANATSTIGLWPGAVTAAWAYRGERSGQPAWARWLILPSAIGAITGTLLLLALPPEWFDALVPWLILVAAILFAVQPQLARLIPARATGTTDATPSGAGLVAACGLQFLVGVYGGYFGAGIGIMMLAMLGMVVNGVAAGTFALGAMVGAHGVSWPHAAVMAVAAILGSLGASHLARRLPASFVRRGVALIGFALAAYYFLRAA